MSRRVMVVGIGKRVVEVARPAFDRAADQFSITDVRARTAREDVEGRPDIRALDALTAEEFAAIDLVYIAVGKPAVPAVLASLARFDRSAIDLLVETPVLVFKQFRHARLLRGWRNVWVAEDCRWLPWIDPVLAAVGPAHEVEFSHSAWKYHGLAMLKSVLGDSRVKSARSTGTGERRRRELVFAGGGRGVVLEPRDYATGSLTVTGEGGRVTDDPALAEEDGTVLLAPVIRDGLVTGFTAGRVTTTLDADEIALQTTHPIDATVTRRMEDLKRIGFLRLLRSIADGTGGYPLAQGVDDMLVDYLLDKFGRVGSLSTSLVKRVTGLPRA